ncbi:hypothetical protein KEU06_28650 [Pseudaminobacter sp. 19-2017]|uniref:Uncharacterized protein n=1 Tax=Pseudaminobacter soli (ex Zhang et al. 2022) TaxID=2831468 RepID=A0A942E2D5_9HYPH|nr:hypothetical protein [Pseudaminobacter soli]MBS3652554.1 hypothetical protein [Pseudaminobacter soli]
MEERLVGGQQLGFVRLGQMGKGLRVQFGWWPRNQRLARQIDELLRLGDQRQGSPLRRSAVVCLERPNEFALEASGLRIDTPTERFWPRHWGRLARDVIRQGEAKLEAIGAALNVFHTAHQLWSL